jgi:hypothetical protein
MSMRAVATTATCALVLAVAALSGGCGDDCQSCTTFSTCPRITKSCPGFTATVQQCSGPTGDLCCVTSEAELSCSNLGATPGSYSVNEGIVSFTSSEGRCLRYWIDAAANGWIGEGMGPGEQEARIRSRMAEIHPSSSPR